MTGVQSDWTPDPDVAARVDAKTLLWQQGDVVAGGAWSLHLANANRPLTPEAAESGATGVTSVVAETDGMVTVSQTCDIVRSCYDPASGQSRPYVQMSPLVRLQGDDLKNAIAGRIPRFARVPGVGSNTFADLDRCTTVEKSIIAALPFTRGCPDTADQLSFGATVARHRARFPFPDDVVKTLRPIQQRLINRAGKNSPEGHRVDDLEQVRAAAYPAWGDPGGYVVELHFVVGPDVLSAVTPEDEPPSDDVVAWLASNPTTADVAARLEQLPSGATAATRSYLWSFLVQQWAALGNPDGLVREVRAIAESADSYPISWLARSAQLELDHLSRAADEVDVAAPIDDVAGVEDPAAAADVFATPARAMDHAASRGAGNVLLAARWLGLVAAVAAIVVLSGWPELVIALVVMAVVSLRGDLFRLVGRR